MARFDFGGTLADFVVTSRRLGGLDTLALSSATLTFWSAQSGGTKYTDLVLNGSAVSSIVVGTDGQVPKFQGPDGVTEMWVDGGSPRIRIVTLQGAPGPAGKDGTNGLPGVNAVANDTATASQISTPGTATDVALKAAYSPVQKNAQHPLTGMYHADGFGAKGDWNGSTGTDDTAALQAAINAAGAAAGIVGGGVVYLGDKAYKHTGLTMPSRVSLRGDNLGAQGPARTRLVYAGTSGGTAISPAVRSGNTINWGIVGVALDGNGLADIVLELYRVSYGRFQDVLISGAKVTTGVGVMLDSAVTGATYFNTFENCKVDGAATGVRFRNGANVNRWMGGALVTCGTSMEFLSLSSGNSVFGTDMETASVKHIYIDSPANVIDACHFEGAPIGLHYTATGGGSRRSMNNQFASTVTTVIQDDYTVPTGAVLDMVTNDTYDLLLNSMRTRARLLSNSTQVDTDPMPFAATSNVLVNWFRNFTTSGIRQWNIYHGDGTGTIAFRFDFGNTNLYVGDTAPGTSAKGVIAIADRITAPTGNPVGHAIYSEGGALRSRTSAGTLTTIAGNVVAKSANYTATTADRDILGTGGTTGITITLPAAVQGSRYTIKKVDAGAGAVTVATTSSQTIDGATTRVLAAQYDKVAVVSDGTAWFIV